MINSNSSTASHADYVSHAKELLQMRAHLELFHPRTLNLSFLPFQKSLWAAIIIRPPYELPSARLAHAASANTPRRRSFKGMSEGNFSLISDKDRASRTTLFTSYKSAIVALVTHPYSIDTEADNQGAQLVAVHCKAPNTALIAVRCYSVTGCDNFISLQAGILSGSKVRANSCWSTWMEKSASCWTVDPQYLTAISYAQIHCPKGNSFRSATTLSS